MAWKSSVVSFATRYERLSLPIPAIKSPGLIRDQQRNSLVAKAKGVDISDLVNDLLNKDLELIETAT